MSFYYPPVFQRISATVGRIVSGITSLELSGNGGKTTLALTDTTANVGLTIGGDANLYRSAADTLKTDDTLKVGSNLAFSLLGFLDVTEISAPAAPGANIARLYVVDNGGKTELVVRFPTGAVQQIAIEP